MVQSPKRAVMPILLILVLIDIWAYSAIAQASLPLPPPPLLSGIPELPSPPPVFQQGIPELPSPGPTPAAAPPATSVPTEPGATPMSPPIVTSPSPTEQGVPPIAVVAIPQQYQPSQSAVQGQPAPPSAVELLSRIDRLDNKVANLEEQLRNIPQPQIPGIVRSPFSFNILLLVNIVTFVLVVYLLFRSQERAVGAKHKEETRPLKNIKDYMRRYQAQGYQIANMKSFLISQGYPRDLVDQAANEMEAEASFKF